MLFPVSTIFVSKAWSEEGGLNEKGMVEEEVGGSAAQKKTLSVGTQRLWTLLYTTFSIQSAIYFYLHDNKDYPSK